MSWPALAPDLGAGLPMVLPTRRWYRKSAMSTIPPARIPVHGDWITRAGQQAEQIAGRTVVADG